MSTELAQVEKQILTLVRERRIAQQELRGLGTGSDEHTQAMKFIAQLDLQVSRLEWQRREIRARPAPRMVSVTAAPSSL